jgi:hypothetical protein
MVTSPHPDEWRIDGRPHLEQAGHSAGPLAEAPILEAPHPPTPPVVGPFRWLLLAHGFSGLAFWGFYGTVFADAAFRFHAGKSGWPCSAPRCRSRSSSGAFCMD